MVAYRYICIHKSAKELHIQSVDSPEESYRYKWFVIILPHSQISEVQNMSKIASPSWREAIESYRDQIVETSDYNTVMEKSSMEDLRQEAKILDFVARDKSKRDYMLLLQPTLSLGNNFSIALTRYFGNDADFMRILRGSIRLILSIASSRAENVERIIIMLQELSSSLPNFYYEKSQAIHPLTTRTLTIIHTEVICFCARCIRFYRSGTSFSAQPLVWEKLNDDFSRTKHSIKCLSAAVENDSKSYSIAKSEKQYEHIIQAIASLKKAVLKDNKAFCVNNMPTNTVPHVWGRDDLLEIAEKTLKPGRKQGLLISLVFVGSGGIGKTKIAYWFAYLNIKSYDYIFWVDSDNYEKMGQSFRKIETLLWPENNSSEKQNLFASIMKFKNWLKETGEFYTETVPNVRQ